MTTLNDARAGRLLLLLPPFLDLEHSRASLHKHVDRRTGFGLFHRL